MSTVVCCSAFAAAGCGGAGADGSSSASPGAPSTQCVPVSRAGATTVTARDDRFDPVCVTIAPGSTATFVVRNAGHHPHNFTLADGSGAHVAVDRGQTAFLTVTLGTTDARFTCTIHPGMRGVIRVEAPSEPGRKG